MFCPVCGNQVEENTKFCGNCGNKFRVENIPTPANDETDAIASFLSEMDNLGKHTEEPTAEINDATEFVNQSDKNRLFLDDDDEEDAVSDDAIVNQFFDNLDSLEEDASMNLTTEYNAETSNVRKIAPVFEEIPDEIPEPVLTDIPDSTPSIIDEDDYSDIVMGDSKPEVFAMQPVIENNVEENTFNNTLETSDLSAIPETSIEVPVEDSIQSVAEDIVSNNTKELPIASNENNLIEELPILESIEDSEPHILIDERPDIEQTIPDNNIGDYNVNLNSPDAANTPYLDSFVSRPSMNIDFESLPNIEPQNEVPVIDATENFAPVEPVQAFDVQQAPVVPTIPEATLQPQQAYSEMPQNPFPPMQTPPPVEIQHPPVSQRTPSHPTVNTKPKKKSNVGVIVTLSIVGVLLIGLVVTGFMFRDTISNWFNPVDKPVIEIPITDPTETTKPDNNTNTSEPDTKPVDQNPNWEIKENSGLDMPLTIGEATVVSKYLDDAKTYENLQVKLSNIVRGEQALTIAQSYEGQTTVRFQKPAEGIEYVVVEYQVYIPSELSTTSTTANLPIEVRGLNTNGVIHNNVSYIVSTWCIEDAENSKAGSLVTCREIFQMPVGCNNYYIVFGTQGQSTAVYKGE